MVPTMDDYNLRERVLKALRESDRKKVLRVESDAAYRIVEEELGEYGKGRKRKMVLDYTVPEPLAQFLEDNKDLEACDHYDFIREYYLERTKKAETSTDLLKCIEEMHNSTDIFVRNPQEAAAAQIFNLLCIAVSINNCGELKRTRLILPGGDWWSVPDFWNDHAQDGSKGGQLNYMRYEHICECSDPIINGVYQAEPGLDEQLRNSEMLKMNIFGPHFSGKSLLLYQIDMRSNYFGIGRCNMTVYPKYAGQEGERAFIEAFSKRANPERVMLVDPADRLSPESLRQVMQVPRLVCASIDKMPGFDVYFDTAQFLK